MLLLFHLFITIITLKTAQQLTNKTAVDINISESKKKKLHKNNSLSKRVQAMCTHTNTFTLSLCIIIRISRVVVSCLWYTLVTGCYFIIRINGLKMSNIITRKFESFLDYFWFKITKVHRGRRVLDFLLIEGSVSTRPDIKTR